MYRQEPRQEYSIAIRTHPVPVDSPHLGFIREAEPLAARHFYLMSTRGLFVVASANCILVLSLRPAHLAAPLPVQLAFPLVSLGSYAAMVRARKRGWRIATTVAAATSAAAAHASILTEHAPNAAARAAVEFLICAAWLHGWTAANARKRREPPLLVLTIAMPLLSIICAGLLGIAYPGSLAGHLVSTLAPLFASVSYVLLMSRAWDRQQGLLDIGPTATEALWLTLVPCQQ